MSQNLKIEVKMEHNETALRLCNSNKDRMCMIQSNWVNPSRCPVALAYCEQLGIQIGTIGVGFTSIYAMKGAKTLWNIPEDLEQAIREWTKHRVPILGTFTLESYEPQRL